MRTPPEPGRPVPSSSSGRPIMVLLDLLGRRWSLRIVWELNESPEAMTFRELQRACGGISSSVLSTRVGELRSADVVEVVEAGYALTAEGALLVEPLLGLNQWADRWAARTARQADLT